jgi:hypothetical protein
MTTSPEKVLELLADKRITSAEADSLLAALKPKAATQAWTWFLNPLERLPLSVALGLGAIAVGLQLLLAQKGVSFDGALDVHASGATVGWNRALLHAAVSVPLTAAVFWGAARALKHSARFIDLVATVGLSRWPALVEGLVALRISGMGMHRLQHPGPLEIVLLLGLILFAIRNITILCLGFRTASGLRGGRLASGIIGALLIAEVLSKIVLYAVTPALALAPAPTAESAPVSEIPKLTSNTPADGEQAVDPTLTEIRLVFDRPMGQKGYSFTENPEHPELSPKKTGKVGWVDQNVFVVEVALEPNHAYAFGINSPQHMNFKSADGVPAIPSVVQFRTRQK